MERNEQRYAGNWSSAGLYRRRQNYKNDTGENYEVFTGESNGLGTCATQYSLDNMDVTVIRDGFEYGLQL